MFKLTCEVMTEKGFVYQDYYFTAKEMRLAVELARQYSSDSKYRYVVLLDYRVGRGEVVSLGNYNSSLPECKWTAREKTSFNGMVSMISLVNLRKLPRKPKVPVATASDFRVPVLRLRARKSKREREFGEKVLTG